MAFTKCYTMCGRNHFGVCREGSAGCFKCGQIGHSMRIYPNIKQSSGNGGNRSQSLSAAPTDKVAPRELLLVLAEKQTTLYAPNNRQEQENSPDGVTGMIRVFDFTVMHY